MKLRAVAIIATMVLLTSNNQTGKLYRFGNKRAAATVALRGQGRDFKNGDKSIQENCIDVQEVLHGGMFFINF